MKLTKVVNMQPHTSDGTTNRTNVTLYTASTWFRDWKYNSANYDGTVAVYLRVDLGMSDVAYTGYCALLDSNDATVSGSEVSTSSTSLTTCTSGDLFSQLTNGMTYHFACKTSSASGLVRWYSPCLIIVQTGTITKTETIVDLVLTWSSINGASYSDSTSSGDAGTGWLYNTDEWDGVTNVDFASAFAASASGPTAYISLNKSDETQVAELSTTATSYLPNIRYGSNITLENGQRYFCQQKATSGNSNAYSARLIITQVNFTKTVCYYPYGPINRSNNAAGSMPFSLSDWDMPVKKFYFEASIYVSTGTYCSAYIYTSGSNIDGSAVTVSAKEVKRSSLVDLTSYNGATFYVNTTADGVETKYWQRLVVVLSSVTITQEGFKFRNDDGSETTASATANQDTNITASSPRRLRVLIDASGDPSSENYQLEYRRKPAGGAFGSWRKLLPE